jgi:hypothetical protein
MSGRLIGKVQRALRRGGLLGTLRQAVHKVFKTLREQTPARRRARRLKQEQDREFDRQHNVVTAGFLPMDRLDFQSSSKEHGFAYDPVDPEKFHRALGAAGLRHEELVFLDLGSGMGKALLLATDYSFRKIIGVEFVPELHHIAEKNLQTFRSDRRKCFDMELVCGDAGAYQLPPVPVVICMFNPFDRVVMTRVIENVRKSWQEHPRELVVVYATPVLDALWAEAGFLVKTASAPGYFSIYKTRQS